MTGKQRLKLIVTVSILLVVLAFVWQYTAGQGSIRKKIELRDRSFSFYGKVVDLDGNPVPDADVILNKRYKPLFRVVEKFTGGGFWPVVKTTDEKGLFSVEEDGYGLFLDRIYKPGYEYHFKHNPKRGFQFYKNKKLAEYGEFPDRPIVFKIRKMREPTLVLHTKVTQRLNSDGYPVFFDLLWQQWTYAKGLLGMPNHFKGWQPDLKIYLTEEQQNFQLVLEAINDDTTLMVDKRELYEAPVSGYLSKMIIPLNSYEDGAGLNTHVYVNGRGGLLYSRMHLMAGVRISENQAERFVELNIDWLTNPNGQGNFEESSELAKQYYSDVRSSKRAPYGYDAKAKGLSIEDVRVLLGK